MYTNNTPDAWDQAEDGGSGDIDNVSKGLGALNVNAAPFVPGQNVFAAEFVPSFPASNSQSTPGEIFGKL